VSDLRRFEVTASLVLVAFLLVVGGGLIAAGHPRAVAGLVAGGLLGLANMVWMVGTAKRFVGFAPTARMLQVAAAIRFLTIAVLLGVVLIVSRVDPVGAVIGYGCFPIAAAVAGWRILRAQPGVPA
jgi:ATP synthase I chain